MTFHVGGGNDEDERAGALRVPKRELDGRQRARRAAGDRNLLELQPVKQVDECIGLPLRRRVVRPRASEIAETGWRDHPYAVSNDPLREHARELRARLEHCAGRAVTSPQSLHGECKGYPIVFATVDGERPTTRTEARWLRLFDDQVTGFNAAPKPQSSSRAGVMSVSPPGPTVSRSAWPKPFE